MGNEESLRFPILYAYNSRYNGSSIAWSVIEPHRRQADINHGQTLERLAERGGLSWVEMYNVLMDKHGYDKTDKLFKNDVDARLYVLNLEQMTLGHAMKYKIKSDDSISLILSSLYNCEPNSMNAKLLLFCLSRLNEGCKSYKDVKIGKVFNFPSFFVTESDIHMFNCVEPLINVSKFERKSYCSACMSNVNLHEIQIGCNNSVLTSLLCKRCLKDLYKQIGGMLDE